MSKLEEVRTQNESLKTKITNIRQHAEEGVTSVVSAALAAGTGASLGLLAAYNKEKPGEIPEVQGVPYSAIAGVVGHLLAISSGVAKKKSPMAAYFRSIGDASLGVAMSDYMKVKGKEWKDQDQTSGTGPAANGRRFGDALRSSIDALSSGGAAVSGFSSLPVTTYG